MLLRAFRRSPERRLQRAGLGLMLICLVLDLLSILNHYHEFQDNLTAVKVTKFSELPNLLRGQKIFIAATHWNSAEIIRSHWAAAVRDLVQILGVHNVYVSIVESGSWDDTKDELRKLEEELQLLGVSHTIVLNPQTHADEIAAGPPNGPRPGEGWIYTPRSGGEKEIRRIPYLARQRNLSLQPLQSARALPTSDAISRFDKILFLNDVVFTATDALTLLATQHGQYAAACAIDFGKAPAYYDTFALRDYDGNPTVSMSFPYFRSAVSRQGMLRGKATPVRSCWNGMVFMDAAAFYGGGGTLGSLAFRGVDDGLAQEHLEGSECCLIHADMEQLGAGEAGVVVNPAVRVGYSGPAYDRMHPDQGGDFITWSEYLHSVWANRLHRWLSTEYFKRGVITQKLQQWKAAAPAGETPRSEPGTMCLINEMQVLVENGWKHL